MNRSIQLQEQFVVQRPFEDVFYYLLDFSNIAQWDVSVLSCVKSTFGAITEGTRFDLVLKSAGRKIDMAYTLTSLQKTQLVFTGVAKGFVAVDSIYLRKLPQGTEIIWQADIRFHGALAYLLPLMQSSLIKLGQESMQGLQQALSPQQPISSQITHSLRSKLILPELWHFTKYGYSQAQKNWQAVSTNMHNKHAVITGATSGLGLASAISLAQKGCYLTLVARSLSKAQSVKSHIIEQTGNPNIDIEIADMSVMQDVILLSSRLKKKQQSIDILINNAGALFNPRQVTCEDLEQSFALLLLSPYMLTLQLKPLFTTNVRVINVLSGGMYSQALDVDDLENKRGSYSGSIAYAKAKRALMIVTEEWAKQWAKEGISVHAMHPGWADTAGVVSALPAFYKLTKPILRNADQGADTIVWLACAQEVTQTSGLFWLDRKPRPTHLNAKTHETPLQRAQLMQTLSIYQKRFLDSKVQIKRVV